MLAVQIEALIAIVVFLLVHNQVAILTLAQAVVQVIAHIHDQVTLRAVAVADFREVEVAVEVVAVDAVNIK